MAAEQLRFLAAHDSDPFVRWESGQQYAVGAMLGMVGRWRRDGTLAMDDGILDAAAATLAGAEADPAFAAVALRLPGEEFIADQMAVVDVEAIHAVRMFLRVELGRTLDAPLRRIHGMLTDGGPYTTDGAAVGRRSLRNASLGYLAAGGAVDLAARQFETAGNMTDTLAALVALAGSDAPEREAALAAFHRRWQADDLVLDKWFSIQATSPRPGTLEAVRGLMGHADFDLRNPNRVRSLIGAFTHGNPAQFHDASGGGYRLLGDIIVQLDPTNGQVAARMTNPLGAWRRHEPGRAAMMRAQLERIAELPKLSRFTAEKVATALG